MPLFSDSKLTRRVAALETQLSEISEGQKQILSLLQASKEPAKSSKEEDKMKGKKGVETEPEKVTEDVAPVDGGTGSEPEGAGDSDEDPQEAAEGDDGNGSPEGDGEGEGNPQDSGDSEAEGEEGEGEEPEEPEGGQEPTAPQPKPKTGKKAAKETKGISLASEVAELKAQLAELTQKGLAQAAANIGIKPIARADKAETAPDEADPVKRTYAKWSRPIKAKN